MAEPRTPTALDDLAEEWLRTLLDLSPELHVELGRPGREWEFTDRSPDGVAAAVGAARAMLSRVRATDVEDPTDAVTRAELIRTLELDIEQVEAGMWQRDLNVIASPAQQMREVFDLMPTETVDDWEHVARRMHQLPQAMSGYIDSLRIGVAARNVPAIRQVHEVAAQALGLAGRDSYFATLAERADTPATLQSELESGARLASQAYDALAMFLREELAGHAPVTDAIGRDLYALASRQFVGAEIDLDETYAWGIDELARMVEQQEAVARQIRPGAGVDEAIAHLERDPAHRLHGTEALQAWMQQASDHAMAELGRTHFDIPGPMRRLECRIAPTHEGGIYYTGPSEDFSRPGRMWWSVPPGVTEFDTWRELTTVYHEGVPGHHLQVGLATYHRDQLNGWRRLNWNSGHGEGWALYAERLMADLGYLDAPADRLGMLDGQRLRAARVVADIGVHLGKPSPEGTGIWTGDEVFRFIARHVTMDEAFVRFEANRYLGWAGQAPSYSVGQRMWQELRDDWTAAYGPDLREFHHQALAVGGVGLRTLREALLPFG